MAFEESRPVTAVFSTNCMAFILNIRMPEQDPAGKAKQLTTVKPEEPAVEATTMSKGKSKQKGKTTSETSQPIDVKGKQPVVKTKKLTTFIIDRDDVDWQGKLKSKTLPDEAIYGLREHVDIRFRFFSS
jgi:hypothetical protein